MRDARFQDSSVCLSSLPPLPIRAIGFDLGETLSTYADAPLNWAALYRDALMRVAGALEVDLTDTQLVSAEADLVSYNTRLNPRIQEVDADAIFSRILATWPAKAMALRGRAVEVFFGFFQQSLRAYPDTLPALQFIRARGLPMGVLTDVPYGMPRTFVEHDLAAVGIASYIDVLLTSVEVGRRKPAPDGILQLMRTLGSDSSSFLYVGNEPKDIQAAKAAGVFSVLIDRKSSGSQFGQDCTVSSLSEVLGLVTPSGH